MFLKELIIRAFPALYIRKNFSALDEANFQNYLELGVEPELLLIQKLLQKDKVFVDVGSNKGLFLYVASKQLSADKIFAFEPNPILYKKIKAVFKKGENF